MALPRVLPDTNICYPISRLDLLLRLDEASLHEILWTEDLLSELARVWVEHGAHSRQAAERICDAIRAAFSGQEVPRAAYAHLIASMPGDDADDHAHAAAAAVRAPATILTRNLRHFPAESLAQYGVSVRTPDDYLTEMFSLHAYDLVRVVHQMAADRRSPIMSVADVLSALERAGIPRLTQCVRALLD